MDQPSTHSPDILLCYVSHILFPLSTSFLFHHSHTSLSLRQTIASVEAAVPNLLSAPLAVLLEKDGQLKKEGEELKARGQEKKAIILSRISAMGVGETEEQIAVDGVC